MSLITPPDGWDANKTRQPPNGSGYDSPQYRRYAYQLPRQSSGGFFSLVGKIVVFCVLGLTLFYAIRIVGRQTRNSKVPSSFSALDDASEPQTIVTPKRQMRPAQQPHYSLGEVVNVGYWAYNVPSVTWSSWVPGFPMGGADGAYLTIRLRAENNAQSPSHFDSPILIDNRGRTFHESSNAFLLPSHLDILREVNPEVVTEGFLVFDVNPTIRYSLLVHGGLQSSTYGLIDIPTPEEQGLTIK